MLPDEHTDKTEPAPEPEPFRTPPVVNIRPGVDVVQQVEEIVEEIATNCAATPDGGDPASTGVAAAALDEIRGLLEPLQQIPQLLENRNAPGDEILRQVQSLAREVRDLAQAPRTAPEAASGARTGEAEGKAERRRVAIDDIQGMIESLT